MCREWVGGTGGKGKSGRRTISEPRRAAGLAVHSESAACKSESSESSARSTNRVGGPYFARYEKITFPPRSLAGVGNPTHTCIWALLGSPGVLLGLSWALLVFPWALLDSPKLSWSLPGRPPGLSWRFPKLSWALLGVSWVLLGSRGALLGSPGVLLGSPGLL